MIFQGKENLKERGSIMLEVIAVLALMGVMGAMLFRQIYLRNQELHNVQMASEMRTVKEAYSACIQARAQDIISSCATTINALGPGHEDDCNFAGAAACVKEYLPSGWFPDNTLEGYYNFYTYAYKQADSSQKVKIYGLVIPQEDTLPATGWNFKRAARVSLLIGADGGVYDEDVTGNDINGSLGTWSLDKVDGMPSPTYVAITGLDIFTPEYDVPEGEVNFPEQWNLQLQNLNVYRQFSVGAGDSCIGTIQHNRSNVDENGVSQVRNDGVTQINASCLPSFWVESSTDNSGDVFVRNDLNVGMDSANGTPSVRISKNGTLVFNQTVTDPQDSQEKSYVLDPAYTSIMNDVKLMSRGGAKLSEILPDYILKTIEEKSITSDNQTISIAMPSCPYGYKRALMLTPKFLDNTSLTKAAVTGSVATDVVTNVTLDGETVKSVTTGQPEINIDAGKVLTGIALPEIMVGVSTSATCSAPSTKKYTHSDGPRVATTTNTYFCVKATKKTELIAQTYCVFDKTNFKTKTNATYNIDTLAPSTRTLSINNVGSLAECRALGGTNWNAGTRVCN